MSEKPILFSGPMVRAILDGKKTQTRRVVRDMPRSYEFVEEQERGFLFEYVGITRLEVGFDTDERSAWTRCPYGKPGDRLWVRETWGLHRHHDFTCWNRDSIKGRTADDLLCSWQVAYAADATSVYDHWRPSIHMPRWASRLTLEVVSVRVERLQEISERDAQAEGMSALPDPPGVLMSSKLKFVGLWDEINGARASWESNPWVWVVTFKRLP